MRTRIFKPGLHSNQDLHANQFIDSQRLFLFQQVLLLQPFNYAKNMVQQNRPISLNPSVMYRGVAANAVNMGSCTMTQFAVGGKMKQIVLGDSPPRPLTLKEEMTCGITGGSVSALIGSPLELVMIQQQVKGGSMAQTLSNIASPSTLTRGLFGCAVREALWTCGYLSIPPVIRRNLKENYPEQFPDDNTARIPAALLGGLFGCYMTHPFDTIKTCMQGDIERKTYGSFFHTAGVIWNQSGIVGFYRGAPFRYGRMACAVFIMDITKDFVSQLLYPEAFQ